MLEARNADWEGGEEVQQSDFPLLTLTLNLKSSVASPRLATLSLKTWTSPNVA